MTLRLSDKITAAAEDTARELHEATAHLRGEERRAELVRLAKAAEASATVPFLRAFWAGMVKRFESEARWGA